MSNQSDKGDALGAQGYVLVEVIRDTPKGPKVIHRSTSANIVVTTGKKALFRIAAGLSTNKFQFGRAGVNSAAAAVGDTNVKSASITGTLHTCSTVTVLAAGTLQLVWSYKSGITAGAVKSGTFKEIAIMNQFASPGGTALARAVLSPLATKTLADKLKLTYTCKVS